MLLHGPSGCGKTLLAQAIAGELGVPFQMVSAPELVGGVSGESEEKVGAGVGVGCGMAVAVAVAGHATGAA